MSAYFDKTKGRWIFDFDKVINGNRVRATKTLPEGWNRTKAEAFNKAETDRLYGIATGTTKERVTIEAAVTLYVKHQCPKLKNGDGVIKELARIHWAYEGKFLDQLADVAIEYTEAERERLAPGTIKNKLSYLRSACRYAQKHHGLGKGEALAVAMPAVRNERHEYANRQQMLQIARKFSGHTVAARYARALLRIGFYSGMRLGEMIGIGQEADGSKIIRDELFYVVDTKNGDNRAVPIHPKLRVLLKYLPVPYKKRWIQRKWEQARDAAGFTNLVFHDVRHSAASAMINNQVDLYTVGAVLGHKDQRSTQRYSHLATDTLAAAIRKIR